MTQQNTGGMLSPYDKRDYQAVDYMPAAGPLPVIYDLRGQMSPARNQGSEGTCTAFALTAGMMDYQQMVLASSLTGTPDREVLSPRDIYEGGRAEVNSTSTSGMWPRAGLEYARKTGVCLETDRPYMPEVKTVPGPLAAVNRSNNKLSAYAAVDLGVRTMKEAIQAFGPLVVVIRTTPEFDSAKANTPIVFNSNKTDGYLHSISIVGWDDTRNSWIVRNSWGTGWAENGHAYMSYDWKFLEAWSSVPTVYLQPVKQSFWSWLLSLFGVK